MINWEYKDYRPAGFECWEASWNKFYSIAISKLSDTSTRYTVRLYYKDMTDLKEHIDAKDWEEAKASAVFVVRDYIGRQANYWHSMKTSFTAWADIDED